jgi:hypothetical protein
MIDHPRPDSTQTVPGSFIFDSPTVTSTQRTSSCAYGVLLWIDDSIFEIARVADHKAIMAATAHPNLEVVGPRILQRGPNAARVFPEGNNMSFALRFQLVAHPAIAWVYPS